MDGLVTIRSHIRGDRPIKPYLRRKQFYGMKYLKTHPVWESQRNPEERKKFAEILHVILQKAKPYTRTRRGKFEHVRGYAGIQVSRSELKGKLSDRYTEFGKKIPDEGIDEKWIRKHNKQAKKDAKSENSKKVFAILTNNEQNKTGVIEIKDPDIDIIAEKGKPYSTKGKVFKEMRSNQCHANASSLAIRGKVDYMVTGFALSLDGGWRQHSWGIKDGTIVETTYPRFINYFGTPLSKKEAKAFAKANSGGDF